VTVADTLISSVKVVGRTGVAEVKGVNGQWLVQHKCQSGLSQMVGYI